jgi:hypothetical protein
MLAAMDGGSSIIGSSSPFPLPPHLPGAVPAADRLPYVEQ